MQGFRLPVWGLGCKFRGFGFRAWGLWFKGQGLGRRAWGLGGLRRLSLGLEYRVSDFRLRV